MLSSPGIAALSERVFLHTTPAPTTRWDGCGELGLGVSLPQVFEAGWALANSLP